MRRRAVTRGKEHGDASSTGGNVATRRPAETTTGAAGAIAALVIAIFDIRDPAIIAPLAVIIGFIPTMITWLVDLVIKSRKAGAPAAAGS